MMTQCKEEGLRFLNELKKPNLTKAQIFEALFAACGTGENVNTKHVFFQEVIIKFNASKATAVIENHMPYETESHYVDVALYAYIKAGYKMKDFDKDLEDFKADRGCFCPPCKRALSSYANA